MLAKPRRDWFRPATRVRCLFGTSMVVAAWLDGQWNAEKLARANITRKMSQISTRPSVNKMMSVGVQRAIRPSTAIMT